MNELHFTLLADGTSDKALEHVLKWILRDCGITDAIVSQWADMSTLPRKLKSLTERIEVSLELYPCEILFIHRDAEKQKPEARREEVMNSLREIALKSIPLPAVVCVVPVRMTEAWFLFDEWAIRKAAGNQHGRHPVTLPKLKNVESIPDPKEVFHTALRDASGLSGRRLNSFDVYEGIHRVAELIPTFEPLKNVPAFKALHAEVSTLDFEAGAKVI